MLKYKANIANQRHRKPPSRGTALNRETMQPAAFEFFNIEEFLDDNFDKSRKEFLLNTACQMREKRGFDCDASKRNRYSMPPVVQARNSALTNHLIQAKQKLAIHSKIENDDESILRKKRPERDSSGQSPAVRPVLRNVTNRGDSNETSEMRNSAPEFLLRAQRVRQSWVEQNGNRIEKLLTENRHSDGPVNKRHSIAVSNMAAKFGETTKSPKPKLLPKPRSPKKTESTLVEQENSFKPIIPAVPKCKVEEIGDKPKDKHTLRIESSPPKVFVPKEDSIEETKEEKEDVTEPIKEKKEEVIKPIKENGVAPKQIIKPISPTKPTLTLQKPAVLPVKPANLSPVKKSFPLKVKSESPSRKSEENEQVTEEKKSLEKTASTPQTENKPNELSKLFKPRPPIASKPKSIHRVKSDTELSRLHVKSQYNSKPADSKSNSIEQENKRKTVIIAMTNHNNEKSLKDDNIETQNADEKKLETSDETNRNKSSSPQQKNCNRPTTPKNGTTTITTTTTTDRSPIIKEKPIFAFLKAKEATNQQSFYKGSDLNRTFISSGLGTPAKVYLNSKDSIQEFGNSKPIIPQPKIITY